MGILDKFKKKKTKEEPVKKEKLEEKVQKPSTEKKVDSSVAKTKEKKVEKKVPSNKKSVYACKYLVKPVISEKAIAVKDKFNKYVFEISTSANKVEVSKAIQELYNVNPLSINIINVKGKNVRYGRTRGKTKNRKKAIVTLSKNDKIEIVEGV